jgi:hypothetical protein
MPDVDKRYGLDSKANTLNGVPIPPGVLHSLQSRDGKDRTLGEDALKAIAAIYKNRKER